MLLSMNNERAIFFQNSKSRNYQLICVKNIFIQKKPKTVLELSQWYFYCATQTEQTTPSNVKKGQHSWIEDFMKFSAMFLIFQMN